ncbi:MAG: sensor histidine kinase [Planctomycetaceae bacterium]
MQQDSEIIEDEPVAGGELPHKVAVRLVASLARALSKHDASERNAAVLELLAEEPAALAEVAEMLQKVTGDQARLEKLESEFEATLLQEKLAAMKELAYGASHEINNPLANIATRAQGLMAEESDPEKRRKLAVITSQAYRAHEMISDMMLFAKPPAPVKEVVDLVPLCRRGVEELQALSERQGVRWKLELPEEGLNASVDKNQFAVMIRALGQNAIDVLQTGGDVRVTLATGSLKKTGMQAIVLGIRDNGAGLSERAQRHLFDPFFSGREAGRGLGFGLSKCWRIVELHQGEIEVQSEPGHGVQVWVRLPR